MAHYCIGNPCWICYPEFAPKQDNKNYYTFQGERAVTLKLPGNKISPLLSKLLTAVFKQGLSEDEYFRAISDELDLEKIKAERAKVDPNSLEASLIDLMIEDFENKTH